MVVFVPFLYDVVLLTSEEPVDLLFDGDELLAGEEASHYLTDQID